MSRPVDGQKPNFPFGNPFRMIFPKGSSMSPKFQNLSNSFELALSERLKKLIPKDNGSIFSISWIGLAIEALNETLTDLKNLTTELDLPISSWEGKLVELYLENSIKLLDLSLSFSSVLSQLNLGQISLRYALHLLETSDKHPQAHDSLLNWTMIIKSRDSKLENCSSILSALNKSLCLQKIKHSAKEKVLMRTIYAINVITVFVFETFLAALSGSSTRLIDRYVIKKFLWAECFSDLQANVYGKLRRLSSNGNVEMVQELEEVNTSVEKLCKMLSAGVHLEIEGKMFITHVSDLSKSTQELGHELELVRKQIESFFQIVLTGREALLGGLKISDPNLR